MLLLLYLAHSLEHFGVGDGYFISIYPPVDVKQQSDLGYGSSELVVYDYINNEIIQTLPNRLVIKGGNARQLNTISPSLQTLMKHDGVFYYHSFYNDMLYAVSRNGIQPHAVLDFGKYKYVNNALHSSNVNELKEAGVGKMRIIDILKHHGNIFLIIDCSEGWFICKYEIVSKQLTYYSWIIINDIDGYQNIGVFGFRGLNNGTINLWNPEDFKGTRDLFFSTIDKSRFKKTEQKEKIERMVKERFDKDATEEENPIVMILHLK